MKSRWKKLLLIVVGAAIALGLAFDVGRTKDIPAGTGYAAHELCTRIAHMGQPKAQVLARYTEPKVFPLPMVWSVDVAPERVVVESVVPTLNHPRAAIYRPGLGCTVVPPGVDEAAVRAMRFTPAPELPRDGRPWPLGDGAPESAALSAADRATIERHAKIIFGEDSDDPRKRRNATALLVARNGKLLFERYAHGLTREQPQLGWSMTKTLTAIVAGLLERDGKIALDQEVGLERWAGTPKQKITWRQLLNMAPGLQWFEGYGGKSDATDMLFSAADQGLWAADRPLTSTPGTVFNYSTGFTNIAMRRMRELLGGSHQAIYDYYQRELFAPLGIRGGVIEPDASGTPNGGARGLLRPVDWLRLGQLVLNEGSWQGKTLLTPQFVAFMKAASPADVSYGGFLWREATRNIAPQLREELPDDIVFFAGHQGQFVIVAPSQRLLVLRMGVSQVGKMGADPNLHQAMSLVAELLKK